MSEINNEERPMTGIESPEENDVPMGRGGFVNSHKGHRRYLKMVQDRQLEYVQCKKADKMKIAWSIVHDLRALEPPARFLRKDPATGLWGDVGDKKFREKVSQALREHQPFIKAVIECDDPAPVPLCTPPPSDIGLCNSADAEPLFTNRRLQYIDPDPEPLCTTRPSDMGLCHSLSDDEEPLFTSAPRETSSAWNLPAMSEQPSQIMDDDFQQPSILVSEDRRRAFLGMRNETNVNQVQSLPEEEEAGFNLSEFSVSQGPSFPDFDEAVPSRRNSSGLDGIFDLLNERRRDIEGIDAIIGNEWNVGAANPDNLDKLRPEPQENYFATMANTLDVEPNPVLGNGIVLKRSSETECGQYDSHSPKRCVLSRDKSAVSRALKEAYCSMAQPEIPLRFDGDEQGMNSLLSALERSFPFPDQY